jgi:hypothetical protein
MQRQVVARSRQNVHVRVARKELDEPRRWRRGVSVSQWNGGRSSWPKDEASTLAQLEAENADLRRRAAQLALEIEILREAQRG